MAAFPFSARLTGCILGHQPSKKVVDIVTQSEEQLAMMSICSLFLVSHSLVWIT